jgi:hypothetical protein
VVTRMNEGAGIPIPACLHPQPSQTKN